LERVRVITTLSRALDQGGVAVEARHELGIGAVEHQERLGRQAGGEAGHLRGVDHRAGGVVGVGDEDEGGALAAGGEDGVDVGAALGLGHLDRGGAGGERADAVEAEAVLGVDHLGAGAGVALVEQGEDLVRAGAADDALGVEPVHGGDGGAQGGVGAVGIDVEGARGGGEGVEGLRRRAERAFVGAELEHARLAVEPGLAADIGGDRENAGLWPDAGVGLGHRRSLGLRGPV
jgi:hypothetical protein